ncbi:MAG: molybdopterin-dependent oxidoreductase [Myxococcales bacterium]|nr:molybdopterin-dependent oxidoreductase [Myxococcales bacterium]
MRINRRNLLKLGGVGAGAALAAGVLPWPFRKLSTAEAAEITNYATGQWVPSCCNMCGGQCGFLGYVENGVLRKIEPNGANPNNVANVSTMFAAAQAAGDIGRLCCKGNSGIKQVYDPDRLKTPLRRVGPRGSGEFVAITWEEAIEEAATRLYQVKSQYGARSIVWFGEDHSFTHLQQDLCDALGTPNYHNHSNLCDTSRKAHYLLSMGSDRPLADMEQTDFLLVWGWNFLSAIKWVHLASIFTRARQSNPNFHFTYVDPVFNTTASKSDRWIAPKPGTDGALALALAKLLIDNNTYDAAFVGSYTLGFAEFQKYLNGDGTYDAIPKTAAWASGITGVPAATITALATDLGAAYTAGRKICIDTWSGPGHHTNATQGGRAINSLNLLLGAIDDNGTLMFPLRSGPGRKAANPAWPAKDGWRLDGKDNVTGTPMGAVTKKYAMSHGSGIYCEARDSMLSQKDFAGNPYPVKCAVFVFQNFVMSTPNTQKNLDAIENMEFVLCVDTHMSETALMADLVIPGSSYLERFDFNANWSTFRSIGLRQPVIESWIGGMSEAQFFLEVGAALGLPGFKDVPGQNDVDENYNQEEWTRFMATGNGGAAWNNQMDWNALKASGVWIETGAAGGTQTNKFALTRTYSTAAGDTVVAITAGNPASQTVYIVKRGSAVRGIANGATMSDGEVYQVGFATESARAQFWSPKMNGYFAGTTTAVNASVAGDPRYHPLPYYLPPEEAPTATFPNYFISWKEVEHTHSRTFNNPWLMEMKGDNQLYVHPTLATAKGLAEGDWVWVQTPYGAIRARAHVTAGIQQDTVGFVRGFGHWAFGDTARGKGAHDGWLLSGKAEIHSGQAVHKEVACRIYKDL